MSSSDLALLATLFDAPFASYAELGRRVGMTGQGARKRVLRLREEGVLRGFVATPAPAIFDRRGAFLTVEGGPADPGTLLDLEDVVLAGSTIDDLCTVVGFLEPGTVEDRRESWLRSLGGPILYEGRYREHVNPPPLGPLAWRVLRALLDDPRAPLTELAARTGLTARTVRDRRRHLVGAGALEVTPLLGPSKQGRLFFHLAVLGAEDPPEAVAAQIEGAVLTERVSTALGPRSATGAVLFCEVPSLTARHALVERARALPGVEDVHAYLLDGYAVHTTRLERWIDEALSSWDAARRSHGAD